MQKRDAKVASFLRSRDAAPAESVASRSRETRVAKRGESLREAAIVQSGLSNPHDFRVEARFCTSCLISLPCSLTTGPSHLLGREHRPDSLRPAAGLADPSKICPESDLNPVCETGVVPTYLLSHIGVDFKAKSVLTAGDVSKSGPYLRLRVLRNNSRSK